MKGRKEFGMHFKNIRIQQGLKMSEMAKLMRISEDAAWKIERGQVCPEVPNLVRRLEWISKREVLRIS